MRIIEKEIRIDRPENMDRFLQHLETTTNWNLDNNEALIRFVITKINNDYVYCEVGIVQEDYNSIPFANEPFFRIAKREYEDTSDFNIVLIIPTGIGCELGGHSGDGGAVARLFASIADNLITHPNVVNAADINELPENGLYVEGSILSRFLMGQITLKV